MNPQTFQSNRRITTSKPHSHPKLRRAASHALTHVGLAKLPHQRSNTNDSSSHHHHSSWLPPPTISSLSHAHALIQRPTSASLSPSVVVLSNLLIPSTSNQLLPDSGPLPPYLAQLYGIHFIGDPNQDPNLENETSSDLMSPSSPTRTSSITTASTDISPIRPTFHTDRIDSISISDKSSDLTSSSSSSSPTSSPPLLNQSLPFSNSLPTPSNLRRLTPRSCRAAFPPIDLESPYAPYAPTPPLSPPPVVLPPSSNNTSCHHHHHHHKTHNSFHLPKTLRKLPSTASMFRKGSKPFGQLAHKITSHSSATISHHHHHNHSSDSVKTTSKDPSLDNENDRSRPSGSSSGSETLEEITSLALRPVDSKSCTSLRSSTPATPFKTLRRTLGLSSQDDGDRPLDHLPQTESCPLPVTTPIQSSPLQLQLRSELDRTITRKTKTKTFSAATTRTRTFSALTGIFKTSSSSTSKQDQYLKVSSLSSRRPLAPTPASDVHANLSSLLSPGPDLEILNINSHHH